MAVADQSVGTTGTAVLEPSYPANRVQAVQPLIQVQDATKQFGKDHLIVHDLNFEVMPGQIFCLLGPSGSGKSTTMRLLTGLYKSSTGEVRVFGVEPYRFKKRLRARIGYMPQHFVLFPELSVLGNVNFVTSVYGMSWFGRKKKIQRALEFVDLWDSRYKLASQLSGGMQRRLELAATLVHNPDLIFVDEPTAGIDPILRAKFWEHFRELRDQGRTLFVTTQYVTEADYCDVVAILNRGRILAMGAPEDIRREAFGGEIINLSLEAVTTQAVRILQGVPGVKFIRFLNAQDLQITSDNAGVTLPLILAALQEANIPMTSIEPYRPDFEEVFVKLMEQDQEEEEKTQENDNNLFRQALEKTGIKPGHAKRPDWIPNNAVPSTAKPVATTPEEVLNQAQTILQTEEPRPPVPEGPTMPSPDIIPSPNPEMPSEPMPIPGAPAQPITPPPPITPMDPDSRLTSGAIPPINNVAPTINQE